MQKRKQRRSRLTLIISVLLTLGMILYLVVNLDWQASAAVLLNANWGWLALSFIVYSMGYVLRTVRFQQLAYTQPLPFLPLLSVTGLYGMFNYLLPAKTGEVSYVLLVNRRLHISLVESATTLVVSRFFDFVTVALFLPVVLAPFWVRMPSWMRYSSVSFIVLSLIGGGIFFSLLGRRAAPITRPASRRGWAGKIEKTLVELVNSLITIQQRRQNLRMLLLTVGIWLCIYTNFYLVVRGLGYPMNFPQAVIVSAVMVPMTLLPFQGFANLGTHEVGWVAAFTLMGYSDVDALNIAVGSHVILLLFVLLLGGLSLLLQWAAGPVDPTSKPSKNLPLKPS
ncbi:MAG: lysylphosphatidylglycerol synthase transmembrane domain-containing protein [Chloroflexota bacterium]